MEGLVAWSIILIPSAIWGFFCGLKIKSKYSKILSGAIPWLGLLTALLVTEYLSPYQGSDASMWPIAQLFAGTIMAVVGVCFYNLGKNYAKK